ncbi:MAG: hypothetical protein IKG03_03840 [Clostridiales bacterium]|nr:hypothetical protein [Clostridiales bacterium]
MYCPNCSKELTDSQKFCGGCGTDVSQLFRQAAPAPAPAPVPAPAPAPAPGPAAVSNPMPAPAPAPGPAQTPLTPAWPIETAPVQTAFGEAKNTPAGGSEPPKKKKRAIGLIIGLAAAGLVLIIGVAIAVAVIVNKAANETEHTRRTTEETEESSDVVSDKAERTIMVYAIGTDLESTSACLSADVKEMMSATPGKDINIVLQSGGCSDFKNKYMEDGMSQRFSIVNGKINELDNLGDVNMIEPDALESFIKFAKEEYPAEKYILVLWDHGGGVPLGFGQDELHEGTLTEIEMAQAIGNCDIEFESIIFNACLMGSLEVAKALDPYTEYIIAAESPTWGSAYYDVGINYTNFLNYIGKDFNGTAKDYGEFIVRDYMDSVENAQQSTGYFGIDTCMSSIDTDNIVEVFDAYEDFIAALDKRVFDQDGYVEYVQLRNDCGVFESTDSVDLTTLASKYINCGDRDIEKAASKLINEVGNCVFTESNNSYTYAHGMTTYAPFLYPEFYDEARLTFVTLGYSDSTVKFYDKFVSKELYILNATNYAGDWYVKPADANSIQSGKQYDISNVVVDMGDYEAIELVDEDWEIIREVKVTLAYMLDDDDETIYYLGTDNQYSIDSNGYIILQNPTNWVYFKDFGFVTCECLKYEVAEDGKWYKCLGAEALVNGRTAYVVIAFSSDDPDGQIIGYYLADIIDDTYDANQSYQFTDNDTIVFVEEYYDIPSNSMDYLELGDAVSYNTAVSGYSYSSVNYDDVSCYIGFDLYDVYNNDYSLPLRPGKPAYEIDAARGENGGYSSGGSYDEGTVDASMMVGLIVIYDDDSVISDAECDWISYDGSLKEDSTYYSDTDVLSLTAELDGSADQTLYYSYFYSPDSMFSDKELQTYIYSGSASPVTENGNTYYHFDYTSAGGMAPGYYIIAVSDRSGGDRILISVCQVV